MTLLLWLRPSGTEYRNNGTCRQPVAMDGGFTFTSCDYSCCDRDRSQPAQSRWSCRTMKSFQSQTWHHLLCFSKASEVQSQAPSYSFLPKESFCKDSISIIAYEDACVNFRFAIAAKQRGSFPHYIWKASRAVFILYLYFSPRQPEYLPQRPHPPHHRRLPRRHSWLRPSTMVWGTCRQPLAMDGGFTFTSCDYSW